MKNNKLYALPIIVETFAFAKNCDWITGEWCDFSVELSFPPDRIKDRIAMLEFHKRREKDEGEPTLVYEFPVIGEQTPPGQGFLEIASPNRNQEITSPVIITGRAKGIFHDGKFRVALFAQDYPYGHEKAGESRLIQDIEVGIINKDCDWASNEWCDFKGIIEYDKSDIGKSGNTLNFYQGGTGELGEGFLMTWLIKLR